MLPPRDSLQKKRHTQSESEGVEKDIPCKWKCGVAILISDKIDIKKRLNDKRVNPERRYNIYKYICN